MSNIAFIDGQNLHLGTKTSGWVVDSVKFRRYLQEKYNIAEAYYFLGFVFWRGARSIWLSTKSRVYFIIPWALVCVRKVKEGNVDCDYCYLQVIEKLVEGEDVNNFFIVSGDGDYKKLVDYLVKKSVFGKMLFPNTKFASSLYKKLGSEYYDSLDNPGVKAKIEYKK